MGRRKTKQASPIKPADPLVIDALVSSEGKRCNIERADKKTPDPNEDAVAGVDVRDGRQAVDLLQDMNRSEFEKTELEIKEDERGKPAPACPSPVSPWVALFKRNRIRPGEAQLRYIPPAVSDGVKVAKILSTEVKKEAEKWKAVLVGSVIGLEPNFKRIESFAMSRWKTCGLISVQMLKPNAFLFQFGTEEDRDQVLKGGPFTFDRRPLILKPWRERLKLNEEELRVIPIWIRLPLLPLEFWGDESLSKITSIVGKPLFSDLCTKDRLRLAYARILVEMDVFGEFPREVHIEDEDGDVISQTVEYEWIPVACKECRCLGHNRLQCPRKGKDKQMWVPRGTDKKAEVEEGDTTTLVDSQGEQGAKSGEAGFTLVQSKQKGVARQVRNGDERSLSSRGNRSSGDDSTLVANSTGQHIQKGSLRVVMDMGYPPDRGR